MNGRTFRPQSERDQDGPDRGLTDVQTIAWACASVIGGLPQAVIEQEPEMESIDGFDGSIVSALRLLVADAGVVDPASGAFRELRASLARWQGRESEGTAGE